MAQVESVKVLLAADANTLHKASGFTALGFAIHKKHPAVEAVLRAHLEAKLAGDAEATER